MRLCLGIEIFVKVFVEVSVEQGSELGLAPVPVLETVPAPALEFGLGLGQLIVLAFALVFVLVFAFVFAFVFVLALVDSNMDLRIGDLHRDMRYKDKDTDKVMEDRQDMNFDKGNYIEEGEQC